MSFFREALTAFALLLIVALSAAVAGPFLVDWTSHRAWIEDVLSDSLGSRVEVAGAIDVKLLPAPSIDLEKISWRGAQPGDPHLTAHRLRLEMAMAPLMRGAVRFVEATLINPRFTVSMGSDGALILPKPPVAAPEEVAFERIEVRGGTLEVLRPDGPALVFSDVLLDGEAASFYGPFKAVGRFRNAGGFTTVRIGAGLMENGRLRMKVVADSGGRLPQVEFDGTLTSEATGMATRVRLDGPSILSGALDVDGVSVSWRASGTLGATPGQARMDPLEVRLGPEERQSIATGVAVYEAATGVASVRLAAPQLDLDFLLGEKDPKAAMERLGRLMGEAFGARRPALEARLEVEASSSAVQLGGETLTGTSVRAALGGGASGQVTLETNLPGRGRLLANGVVETGAAARFSGRVEASVRDVARLADWAGRADADLGARLRSLPAHMLDLSGRIELSAASVDGRELTLKADRSTFNGSISYRRAVGGQPAHLFANLTSPTLDLEGVPDLQQSAFANAGIDLNVSLDARAVRLARMGEAALDAGRIRARLKRAGGVLELEQLSIENLGGATLEASGVVNQDGLRIKAVLDAQRLLELAALVRRAAPGDVADRLFERAVALSPANMTFNAEAATRNGAFVLRSLKIEGAARGSRIDGEARPAGEGFEGKLELSSNDAPMLLRQLGFEAQPQAGLPPGRITLRGKGDVGSGLEGTLVADMAGATFNFEGRVARKAAVMTGGGKLRVASKDAGPLLQALGLALPDAKGAAAIDASADILLGRGGVEFTAISGSAFGTRVAGALKAARPLNGRLAVTGSLIADRMSLAALSGLALGPPKPIKAGALWSDERFSPGLADPPDTRIDLRAGLLDLRGGLQGREASLSVRLDSGLVELDGISMRVGATSVGGRLSLRREKAEASLAGRLQFETSLEGRPDLGGRLAGLLDLAATGASEAALMGNLAGSGEAHLLGGLRRAEAGALDRVIAAAEKDSVAADEATVVAALAKELDKPLPRAAMAVAETRFDVVVAGGVVRLQPTPLKNVSVAHVTASAALDLRTLQLDEAIDITSRNPPPGWTGAAPRVRVVWSGPVDRTQRTIEAGGLVNGLSARAILREAARIEAVEVDIRERAAFNRRLKAQEWLRQRGVEIEAWRLEQARLAEEARRRAAEDERRKAIETARLEREAQERERKEIQERERKEIQERERRGIEERRAQEAASRRFMEIMRGEPAGAPLSLGRN